MAGLPKAFIDLKVKVDCFNKYSESESGYSHSYITAQWITVQPLTSIIADTAPQLQPWVS